MPDGLYEIAAAEGIRVEFYNLPEPLLGIYDSRPGKQPLILLHENTRSCRKFLRCILAEEIGHHYTCTHNIIDYAASKPHIYNKYDRHGLWWAVQYLVPFNKLMYYVNIGVTCMHELSEALDVTEDFLLTGISMYKNKGMI